MVRAALRRFVKLFVGLAAVTAVISLGLGLLVGASPTRALSIGFYLAGCFFLIGGFFLGNRGPVRPKRETTPILLFGSRELRWATAEERDDALNSSALFVVLGFALIVIGVLADTRYQLF
jgi:uncharacterized membrane protein HdeD (DUF308 family)